MDPMVGWSTGREIRLKFTEALILVWHIRTVLSAYAFRSHTTQHEGCAVGIELLRGVEARGKAVRGWVCGGADL